MTPVDDDLARAITQLPLDCFLVLRVEEAEDETEKEEKTRRIISAVVMKTPSAGGPAVVQVGVSVDADDVTAFESLVIDMVERYCLVIEAEQDDALEEDD
jgi:hypothetical protein